jgi:hypothetical protein
MAEMLVGLKGTPTETCQTVTEELFVYTKKMAKDLKILIFQKRGTGKIYN